MAGTLGKRIKAAETKEDFKVKESSSNANKKRRILYSKIRRFLFNLAMTNLVT